MKELFYGKALPKQGRYCLVLIDRNEKVFTKWAESLSELIELADHYDAAGYNTFVAMHSFSGHSRIAAEAVFAKSFFLDLDVGASTEKKKKYESQYAALEALGNFVESQGLPPPVVVNSGRGVHAYWLFDEDIPSEAWVVYARLFKRLCEKHILIDRAVSADRARVLRFVGTHNYKGETPLPTGFFTDNIYEYSFDAFKEFLGAPDDEPSDEMAHILATVQKGLDEDTDKIARIDTNFESVFAVLAQKSLDNEGGCPQVDYMLRNASTLSEPMWRAGLSLARACIDWEESIQAMSATHPGYSPEKTIEKANLTVGSDGPHPYKCSTIDDIADEDLCSGCVFRGKITSPIQLAKRLKVLQLPDELEEETAESEGSSGDPSTPVWHTYPTELEPYLRGPNGGVWYKPPSKKGKDGQWMPQDEIQILPYSLYPIRRMFGGRDGEVHVFQYSMVHDGIRTFTVSGADTSSMDRFKTCMARNGVVIENGLELAVLGYVKKWVMYMQNWKRAEDTRSQMGWTKGNKSFVIGSTEYHPNGVTTATAASSLVDTLGKLLTKIGSLDKWKAAANKLDKPHYEVHAFALMCGFGSPLLRLTARNGGVVGLIGSTGAGKSGALYACGSIWGDPFNLGRAGAKDSATMNGLTQWMMGLKNIPMTLDETSNYKPEDVSNITYKATQGQGKIRAQASTNDIREIEFEASLITIVTANQSMVDKLTKFKANPDGELARYLEFNIVKPPTLDNVEGESIFQTFRMNYGHAGPLYVQYLLDKGDDYAASKYKKWADKFYDAVGQGTEVRFYESTVATGFAGAELAKEIDLLDWDLDRIFAVIVSHIIKNKEGAVSFTDYDEILGTFQNEHQGSTLVLNSDKVIREPRTTSVIARIVVDEGTYYVARSALRKHLSEMQISEKVFIQYMESKKILIYKGRMRLTSGWPGMSAAMSAVYVYGFRVALPKELFDDNGD